MVTGDLMESSANASMQGSTDSSMQVGSHHGGSLQSTLGSRTNSFHGFLTPRSSSLHSSLHGFLTSRGEYEPSIVSSRSSPVIKNTFKQLGGLEDGWLIEMYYKLSATYQRSAFRAVERELNELFKAIAELEEHRFLKLNQVMLAFVPRQMRLFGAFSIEYSTPVRCLASLF